MSADKFGSDALPEHARRLAIAMRCLRLEAPERVCQDIQILIDCAIREAAKLAAESEREACAQICETTPCRVEFACDALDLAEAIRARGSQQ